MTSHQALELLPPPPKDSIFKLESVEEVAVPHTYLITPRHEKIIVQNNHGVITEDSILDAEKQGARCGSKDCLLVYKQHKKVTVCMIRVPRRINKDAQEIPGLWEYLKAIQHRAILLGIDKFSFPYKDREETSISVVLCDAQGRERK